MTAGKRVDMKTDAPDFVAGGGEMGERIRAHDWAATPFGPLATWPQSLRSALSICLNSQFPTAIYWGPDLRVLYNDAWAPIPGPRHPDALGQPAKQLWADIWHVIGPQLERVMTGEGFAAYDQMLPMQRFGSVEETYWNYNFSPIRGEHGGVCGVFNSGSETTASVLAARRLKTFVELADRLRDLSDPAAVKAAAVSVINAHTAPLRCAYAELDERGEAVVTGFTAAGEYASDRPLAVAAHGLRQALAGGGVLAVEDVGEHPLTKPDLEGYEATKIAALAAAPIIRNGGLAAAFIMLSPEPRRWSEAETDLAAEAAERIWNAVERARAETAWRESEARFQFARNASHIIGAWDYDVPNNRVYADPSFARLYSVAPEAAGAGVAVEAFVEGIHPDDRDWVGEKIAAILTTGGEFAEEYRVVPEDGERWVYARGHCYLDEARQPVRFPGVVVDITERKEAENLQRLLVRELHHRVKNNLATVQSVVNFTLRTSNDMAQFRKAIGERIESLARTHELLAGREWRGAPVGAIFRAELRPYDDGERVRLDGPDISLPPDLTAALAMAAHELATNAAKHGSLSGETGRVDIIWRIEPSGEGRDLHIDWVESGGPEVTPAERRGFGMILLEQLLGKQLGGSVTVDPRAEGVRVHIVAAAPETGDPLQA